MENNDTFSISKHNSLNGILTLMQPYSVYIHIPFCNSRCTYCDFNTSVGAGSRGQAYIDALCKEIKYLAVSSAQVIPVHTVYFGGGTPSILAPKEINRVLGVLDTHFDLSLNLEVSLEANPGTVSKNGLASLRTLGVNRLSLGMQSSNPDELALLGRLHDPFDSIQAVKWARQAGFLNINLDLIFGLPGQNLRKWKQTLDLAIRLNPDHFSLYGLTIEDGTRLFDWVTRGLVPYPDPDLGADMYEFACEKLMGAGYLQYEISNWSRPGFECRHNLQYWQNFHYFGLGVGAHGFVPGFRTVNTPSLESYIQCFQSLEDWPACNFPRTPAIQNLVRIDEETEIRETMMLGLRLTEMGIAKERFSRRFGHSLADQFGPEIKILVDQGLLIWNGDILRLTAKGRLLGNQVFQMFV